MKREGAGGGGGSCGKKRRSRVRVVRTSLVGREKRGTVAQDKPRGAMKSKRRIKKNEHSRRDEQGGKCPF